MGGEDGVLVPNLEPAKRSREYNGHTEEQRDRIVYNSLFVKEMTNRNIDEKILGLNPAESRGWQSMGVLHHLGLKNPHKGIFIGYSIDDAIKILKEHDALHFKPIIDSLSRFKQTGATTQVFNSWELLDDNIALKTIDKSIFAHFGTSIPMGIRGLFQIGNLGRSDKKAVNLIYNNTSYEANILMDNLDNPRSRIFWKADFRDLLKETIPTYYDLLVNDVDVEDSKIPKIRFFKVDETHFNIGFIYPNEIEEDI